MTILNLGEDVGGSFVDISVSRDVLVQWSTQGVFGFAANLAQEILGRVGW